MTERKDNGAVRAWVFYDGDCSVCVRLVSRLRRVLERRGFALAPLQASWVQERLGLRPGEPFREMQVFTPEGKLLGGADGVMYLARAIWWAWPLRVAGEHPAMMQVLRRGYAWVAKRRHCIDGACGHRG